MAAVRGLKTTDRRKAALLRHIWRPRRSARCWTGLRAVRRCRRPARGCWSGWPGGRRKS